MNSWTQLQICPGGCLGGKPEGEEALLCTFDDLSQPGLKLGAALAFQ